MHIPGVFPDDIKLFGYEVSETLVNAYVVLVIVVVLALVFRFAVLRNFKAVPKGIQNVLEMAVSAVNKFSTGILGEHGASIAPYILTLFAFIICNGAVEFLGFRSAMTDLNCTIGMAAITFALIIAYSVRYKGVKGWLKTYSSPSPIVTPFNIISSIAVPVSLACRLFGNMFSGLVVMDMIYGAMGYFAIFLPALASTYFILFHLAMQSYVFTMLTMSFMKEKLE
ncbi:MAG TPA: hypothetical protein DEB31_03240 [Clostridiales bacterium]|nr:hypothetical protein [Clostridiales bacterium]